MTSRYRMFFGQEGVPTLVVAGVLGRIPNGMLALAFILSVVHATGSYPAAGAAAAAYTVTSAVIGPLWSRLADRIGPRTVLVITSLGQATALCAVAVGTSTTSNAAVAIVLAGASGLFLPPLGAIMRSIWSKTLTDPDVRASAFAFESVVVDLVFIVGPSLVAGVSALTHPSVALFAAAGATAVGCLWVAASPKVRTLTGSPRANRHWLGPLRHRKVLGLLPIGLLLMGSIAVIEVSLVAFSGHAGKSSVAGILIAILSVGGVVGGLYWGSRRQPGTAPAQLAVLLGGLAVGWALLALPGNMYLLGALLILAGLTLNPAITAMFSTMDEVAPEDSITESFGWLNALGAAGSSAGAAAAGVLVGQGADRGFLLAAVMCGVACVIGLAALPMRRRQSEAEPASLAAADLTG